ncbi:phosphoribosylglycinamide formyltransferase [Taylorella equigenitalis]|uniref:Phosphoribosylglycinamide formyltransferase n=3 Tax=Taylorella equigenitalis TaxID=29575 RepID=A0A654KGK6_TAYEM|nr:phosphoribosylglycinamide formyltransferase [Taylorella equigenitalis]ADU91006.1 Phosphoribosylglycinamide formyltransferase [Taylorella equigenitalis MCE9]AFN36113.1 phosphoribosylglycinamide formyltransferase 1 [Taylorella equigenitalis ATCC 35865]ASY30748.1 phosphoribosylglycinamide formyltransferase [Taylorella equigenitalis]ASY38047.1 phosphoribosylglycinamide formyltransferase [Taylorella equigenitalis]ASY39525.1 phosphoribosylglycinamide formyltransferase [Taylorella equigenitalis]
MRFVILISGRGSNMKAIVERAKINKNIEIVAVISHNSKSLGLNWAKENGIHVEYVPLPQEKGYDRAQFDYELLNKVLAYSPDYVLLAGYMRILNSSFVDGLEGRLINIHPSLLPSFAGLDTHERALKTGVCVHGCTVHFVNPQLDDGPIIAQGVVPVFKSDSAQTLADRVLKVEHQVYPTVVEYLTQGIVRIDDRVVKFDKEVKTTFYSEEI